MRVDFYLLQEETAEAKWLLACRLLEKAYRLDNRVFVYCNHKADAEKIDELLWTFKEDSFIPHNLQGEGPEPPPPIQIGYQGEPRGFSSVLLNMSTTIPTFFNRFARIIEIVSGTEAEKEHSRQLYRQYRAAGCALYSHQLSVPQGGSK